MKKPIWVLSLVLLWMLLPTGPSVSRAADENCVDEICDGLDNDCDKSIDDFVDCGLTSVCACGQCTKAAVDGKCAEGVPWQGNCVVDHCPAGRKCNMQTGQCRRI